MDYEERSPRDAAEEPQSITAWLSELSGSDRLELIRRLARRVDALLGQSPIGSSRRRVESARAAAMLLEYGEHLNLTPAELLCLLEEPIDQASRAAMSLESREMVRSAFERAKNQQAASPKAARRPAYHPPRKSAS